MPLSKKSKIAILSSSLGVFLFSGIAASMAWFDPNVNSIEADVSGSVVEEYFHCGDGSLSNPYVITRPIHYYHMVEFFQRLTSLPKVSGANQFGTDYLYFQVGYDFGDGVRRVYNYDSTGIYQGTSESPSYSLTLDMGYYSGDNALMPIGTNEVPFIGNFDGGAASSGGIVIKNLNIRCAETVVVNGVSTLRHASDIGVFGYIADQDASANKTVIQNAYFEDLNIDLTDATSTVASSSTSVAHVDGHAGTAHVGYIAGHVHSYVNYDEGEDTPASPLSNVYVKSAKVQGGAGVASNFGYIGKVDTIDGAGVSSSEIGDSIDEMAESRDGVGQGDSINMANLYRRLLYYYRSMSGYEGSSSGFDGVFDNDEPDYAWRVNRDVDIDGNETINSSETTNQMLVHAPSNATDDKKLGTVSIWNRHSQDSNEDFMYLTGGRWANGTIEQEVEHRQMRITLDGVNFLTATSTSTFASAPEASSSLWTITGTSSRISSTYNGTPVYLRNNGGTLAITTAVGSATTWSIADNGTSLSIGNGSYELTCNGSGTWSLSNTLIGYRIYYTGGYYIGAASDANNAQAVAVTDKDSALVWNYDGSNLRSTDGRYLTCYVSGTTYQARLTNSNSNSFLTYTANSTESQVSSFPWSSSSRLRATISNKQYRLRFSSNKLNILQSTSKTNVQNCSAEPAYGLSYGISPNYIDSITYGPDTEQVESSGMEYKNENTSIIPLNVVQDGEFTTKENYYAARKNNGYLTAGAGYSSAGAFDGIRQSEVRVSRYKVSNISKSYNSSTKTFTDIRTIHGTSDSLTDETLTSAEQSTELYTKSLAALKETLDNEVTDVGAANAYVYGLHFMDSAISTDRLVTSQYAVINGSTKSNYELPVDAIDFNLHEKRGFVNFFAGTYFAVDNTSSNNTFFSLHDILREGNKIKATKEIYEIYTDGNANHSYVYKYADGLYSQAYDLSSNKMIDDSGAVTSTNYEKAMNLATKPSTYSTLSFSTARIRVTDAAIGTNLGLSSSRGNTLYYFEIPINKGEYALGSVPGKDGAYLIYLDVGSEGHQGDFNVDNLIASGPLFTQIGFSNTGFMINSVFNISYVVPAGSDKNSFYIAISIRTGVSYNDKTYTCFDLDIVNTSGAALELSALLTDDDDDNNNDYLYMYSITYNGGSRALYTWSDNFSGASGGTSMTPEHPQT